MRRFAANFDADEQAKTAFRSVRRAPKSCDGGKHDCVSKLTWLYIIAVPAPGCVCACVCHVCALWPCLFTVYGSAYDCSTISRRYSM